MPSPVLFEMYPPNQWYEATGGAAAAKFKTLEAAILAAPDSGPAAAALRAEPGRPGPALDTAIGAAPAQEGLFEKCFVVLETGDKTFVDVYGAVWNLVVVAQGDQLAAYTAAAGALVARLPRTKRPQTTGDVVELYRAAARVKPRHDAGVLGALRERLAARGAGVAFTIPPPLKGTARLCEKRAFKGTVAAVSDLVRAMVVALVAVAAWDALDERRDSSCHWAPRRQQSRGQWEKRQRLQEHWARKSRRARPAAALERRLAARAAAAGRELERVAHLVAVDFAPTDMVGGTDLLRLAVSGPTLLCTSTPLCQHSSVPRLLSANTPSRLLSTNTP